MSKLNISILIQEHFSQLENPKQEINRYKCEQCEKAFRDAWHLKEHVSSVHEGLKSLQCKFCGKAFGYVSNLSRHLKVYHSELKIQLEKGSSIGTYEFISVLNGKDKSENSITLTKKSKPRKPTKTLNCDFCEEIFHSFPKLSI